jgi:hypothetical protein
MATVADYPAETRNVVAFMDSLPSEVLVELLRRVPDMEDPNIVTWAARFNPAAVTLGPDHLDALRHVINRRGIPGLEALAAAKAAWRRLVEMHAQTTILSRIDASACQRTRSILQRPDILWRISAAIRRLLRDTDALNATDAAVAQTVLQCLRIATHERYCTVWRDVFAAFVGMDEFQAVRTQAFEFARDVLDRRMKTGSVRLPQTPERRP